MQKQAVLDIVEAMPEDVSIDDLLNKLYVLAKIEAGERALAEQGGVSQQQVEERYCR